MTACVNVCAQVHTVVFPMVFSVWNQAGFAKLNFHPKDWRRVEHAQKFMDEFQPWFLTGDPVAYAEMIRWGVRARPRAVVSTAVELSPSSRRALEDEFGCPVIDWLSTTETGPIACSCPQGHGFHIVPPDVFVEVLDEDGLPAPDGQPGEIAVTGGRNPYLPLLRSRTGDFAVLDRAPCPCGDPTPRLVDLQGRAPVHFRAASQAVVNPADVGRVLREFVFLQHEFLQHADNSCDLHLRPHPGIPLDLLAIKAGLETLFGPGVEIRVAIDDTLAERGRQGKVSSFRSET
jgi:phenylacetate-CoA ligase